MNSSFVFIIVSLFIFIFIFISLLIESNAEMEDYVRRQRLQSIGNDDMSDNGETSSPVPIPVVIVSDDDDDKEEEKKVEKILSKKQKRKLKQKKIDTPPPVKKRKVNDGSPGLCFSFVSCVFRNVFYFCRIEK